MWAKVVRTGSERGDSEANPNEGIKRDGGGVLPQRISWYKKTVS